MMKFKLGQLVCTRAIAEKAQEDLTFNGFVQASFHKYINCDWGDTCKEDAESNDYAIKHDERLLAVYKQPETDVTIWIITEWDRSVTTILFPSEY
jgi:hypothetical protein